MRRWVRAVGFFEGIEHSRLRDLDQWLPHPEAWSRDPADARENADAPTLWETLSRAAKHPEPFTASSASCVGSTPHRDALTYRE